MRKAFSLIELLIVVLIIGIVYTLAVGNFQKIDEKESKVSLKSLKDYLQGLSHERSVKILCLDDCVSCSIFIDGEKQEELEGKFDNFLDDTISVYTYDFTYGTQVKIKDIYFNEENVDEEVCFSYEVDKKGVGAQVYIKFKEKIYDFTSYLTPTPIFSTLEEAVDFRENLVREVR